MPAQYNGEPSPLAHGVFGERFFSDLKKELPQEVLVTEIRPHFEGARQTARLIAEMGIQATLITDNMVACCMWQGKVKRLLLTYQRWDAENLEVIVGTDLYFLAAVYFGLPISWYPSPVLFPPYGDQEHLFGVCGIRIAPHGIAGWVPLTATIPWTWIGGREAAAAGEVFHLEPATLNYPGIIRNQADQS